MQIFRCFWIIQAIIGVAVEVKRRFVYCEFRSGGLYIYNNNRVKFGYGRFGRKNALIGYDNIVDCKIIVKHDVPQEYSPSMRRGFFLKSKMQFEEYPAIAGGDFSSECIAVYLKNKTIVYLPIKECDEFIEEYNQLTQIRNNYETI